MKPNMTTPEALLPKGVKDFLPRKAAKIDYLTDTLKALFHQWGFRPVVPPLLENLDVLEAGLGSGLQSQTFRFDDRQGGRLVAVTPDITPQVARIVATRMQDLPLPLRLCYTGRVLRHTEQQAGKDRELFQAGVELFGLDSPEVDAEMIVMAIEGLRRVGAEEFTIDLGQVEFVRAILADLPLAAPVIDELREALMRKDSSSLKEALARTDLDPQRRDELLALPRLFGGLEILAKAEEIVVTPRAREALDNLRQVIGHLDPDLVENYITFDLGEIRGLDYHTGVTFQGYLPGIGRAVCSGGRYDNLTDRYGRSMPATGFSFNLLNLLFALDQQLDQRAEQATDVLLYLEGANKGPAQRLARALRDNGFSAARDMLKRPLEESLAYARQMNYRYLMAITDENQPVQLLSIKDGSEQTVDFTELENSRFDLLG